MRSYFIGVAMGKDLTLIVRAREIGFRQHDTVGMTRLGGTHDFLQEIDPVTDFVKECPKQLGVSNRILGYPDKMMTPIPCHRMAVFAEAFQFVTVVGSERCWPFYELIGNHRLQKNGRPALMRTWTRQTEIGLIEHPPPGRIQRTLTACRLSQNERRHTASIFEWEMFQNAPNISLRACMHTASCRVFHEERNIARSHSGIDPSMRMQLRGPNIPQPVVLTMPLRGRSDIAVPPGRIES
jgi:hypothetical protein